MENKELDLMEVPAPSRAENQELGIVEGSASSRMKEKPTSSISIRRARFVGAPATPGVMAHCGKEEKKEERKPLDIVRSWTNWNFIKELPRTSWA
jgi:hypothetical protein